MRFSNGDGYDFPDFACINRQGAFMPWEVFFSITILRMTQWLMTLLPVKVLTTRTLDKQFSKGHSLR